MPNRTDLSPTGFVDDLVLEGATLEIRRTGAARYAFEASTADGAVALEIWTTAKETIRVRFDEGVADKDWCTIQTDGDVLESVSATDCTIHLEQLDQSHYYLGLFRAPDEIRLRVYAGGYVKVRPVQPAK
jgi:hypothetical protein